MLANIFLSTHATHVPILPLSLIIIINKSKDQWKIPSPCLGLRTEPGCRPTLTHSHVPFGHTVEGRDYYLFFFILVKLAWSIRPGTLEGTWQMLIVLRVGQKKILIGQCCRVPGRSRTPAKFCSSNWEILCTYTYTHSHGTQ